LYKENNSKIFFIVVNRQVARTTNLFGLFQKKLYFGTKPRVNLTSNIPLERALFMLQKSSINVFSHLSSDEKKLIEDR